MNLVDIYRARPRIMCEDYLVRGIGKRAILVVLNDVMLSFSKYERYMLIEAMAKYAYKRRWKVIVVGFTSELVHVRNAAHCESIWLGDYRDICESDHFLNDDYYHPDGHGFSIKNTNTNPFNTEKSMGTVVFNNLRNLDGTVVSMEVPEEQSASAEVVIAAGRVAGAKAAEEFNKLFNPK